MLIFRSISVMIEMKKVVEDKGEVLVVERNFPFTLLIRIVGLFVLDGDTLEQFELLIGSIGAFLFLAEENFYIGELLVGDTKYANIAFLGQDGLYPPDMHIGIVHAGAMSYIDRELKHGETVGHDFLTKLCGYLSVFFGVGRQVV